MQFGKKNLAILIMLLLAGSLSGQTKKIIRSKGIVSNTTLEYFIEEGMDEPVVETVEKFNKDGELVEIQEFNKRGEVRLWEKYTYDADGNLVEEVFLDEKGKISTTEKNIYKDSLRVEKQYFNAKGKLFKKKVYEYEYSH